MIYAIPCNDTTVSNHFSKCQQIAVFDDSSQRIEFIPTNQSDSRCGVKKLWQQVITGYKVDVVVVRNVGQNMLKSLFQSQVKVVAAPAKQEIESLCFDQLTQVESLDYAKESPNKKPCCGHKTSPHLLTPSQPNWHEIRRIKQ